MMKNILIIKLSAIGDVIHALPVAAAIKKQWPDCHLTWVVSPVAAEFIKYNPVIDEVIIFERKKLNSLWSFLRYKKPFKKLLRKRKYDVCIDLQGLLKSAMIAHWVKAKKKIGYANMREGSWLISRAVSGENCEGHIVERYLDVVRYLGCSVAKASFPLGINADEMAKAKKICRDNMLPQKQYVVFAVGANWPNKRWPTRYFADLARFCVTKGYVPVLAGSGAVDEKLAAEIKKQAKCAVVDLVGKTSLRQLAYIMRDGAATVGGDTGIVHLSAAVKTPTIMVMGPTDATRNGPYRQKENAIEVSYKCRHCWKRKCKYDRDCLDNIRPQQVKYRLIKFLD